MTTKIKQLTNSRSPFLSRYWRDCADDARVKASGIRDRGAKETLLGIARIYDQMAEFAQARERRKRKAKREASR